MVECDHNSISTRPLDPQKVCLLDMRGTQPLEPEDADLFTHFVLGGILGDDPPRYEPSHMMQHITFAVARSKRQQSNRRCSGCSQTVVSAGVVIAPRCCATWGFSCAT
eukprot:COSAG03_NODE_857_length_5606_cov_136.971854_4_plen_108_part_00